MQNTPENTKPITVSEYLQGMTTKSAEEFLLFDTEQMAKTMKEWPEDQENKKEALKKVMAMAALGLEVRDSQGRESKNLKNFSIATYFSHGQRIKVDVEDTNKNDLMNCIAGGANQISTKDFAPTSIVNDGGKVMHNRAAGTHGIEINKKGVSKELKGKKYGVFSGILKFSMFLLRPVSFIIRPVVKRLAPKFYERARIGLSTQHWGINMAIQNPVKQGEIKADGTNGHMYLNFTEGKNAEKKPMTSFLVGIEPSAPNQKSASGAGHSKTGGKSNLSPVGSFGWYDKASSKNKNFLNHIKNMAAAQKNNPNHPSVSSANNLTEKDQKTLDKINQGKKVSKEELHKLATAVGIEIRKIDGKEVFLYPTAKKLADAGFSVPKPYGGLTAKISASDLRGIKDQSMPDEIIYFKPAKSFEDLMKQAPIFADIENKPLLKNNPHLDLKQCLQISLAYSMANLGSNPEIKKMLQDLESTKSISSEMLAPLIKAACLENVDPTKDYVDNQQMVSNKLSETERMSQGDLSTAMGSTLDKTESDLTQSFTDKVEIQRRNSISNSVSSIG